MVALLWWQWVVSWAAGGVIGFVIYCSGEYITHRRVKRRQNVDLNGEDPSEEGSPGT